MAPQEFQFNIHHTVLQGYYWKAASAKAAIVLVHGMGEHAMRYADSVIPAFLKHDISVISYDQFGHGNTQGKKGHNPGYEAVLDCVQIVSEKALAIFGDIPLFLYGHSMGGNVVINYVLKRKHPFKGVIATSPFLRLAFQPPSWKLAIGKILQKIAPSLTMGNELDVNAISRDAAEVQKYTDDPLVHDKISPNYSLTFMKTGEWAIENASQLSIPMLVLHGTGDQIISYKASETFVKNTNGMATLHLFDGGYHELHHDLCKQEMMAMVVNWVESNLTQHAL